MKKIFKILLIIPLIPLSLSGNPYIGGEVGYSLWNTQVTVKGVDNVSGNSTIIPYGFSHKYALKNSAYTIGMLLGYSFQTFGALIPFLEADYHYSNQKKKITGLDYYDDVHNSANDLRNQSISVKQKHGFGFMPGVDVRITDALLGVLGIRFTMMQYVVHAADFGWKFKIGDGVQKKVFLFGAEPTIGLKHTFTNGVSLRFTVGYQLGQNKKVIDNYVLDQAILKDGTKAAVFIKPGGTIIRAAIIYMF